MTPEKPNRKQAYPVNAKAAVISDRLIYVWPVNKQDFDRIGLVETFHDWQESEKLTLYRNDGWLWERRAWVKTLEQSGILVVFQYFEDRQKSPLPTASNEPIIPISH